MIFWRKKLLSCVRSTYLHYIHQKLMSCKDSNNFKTIRFLTAILHRGLRNDFFFSSANLQGVKVNSGKSLGPNFGRIQCWHCNKRYFSRKSLISALIWHPESGCGTIRRLSRPHRRQEVKNPPRGPMLFAARGRGALLVMPRPFWGCQIKAEIQGFLLRYRLFLH